MNVCGLINTYTVLTVVTTMLLLLSESVSAEVSRRFLFGDFCKVCYDCVCLDKWEECPIGTHEQTTSTCKNFIDKTEDCNKSFQTNGGWTHWSSWGKCTGDCSSARRRRHRSCTNPAPANCGAKCKGEGEQFKACPTPGCTTPTTTLKPTTKITTTTTTTVKPTSHPVTSILNVPSSCSKFCSVASVAQNHTSINSGAEVCSDGSKHGSEALLAQCCKFDISVPFTKHQNVYLSCRSLPSYIPVARFDGSQYVKGTAGIFVNCLDNGEQGFRFIHQACNKNPEIVHVSINNTDYGAHTIRYYVIS